jgi:hypothetical protein
MAEKVIIATPVFGGALGRYVASLTKTLHALQQVGQPYDVLILDGDAYIARARNTLALSFMQGDGDVLFFIDQDMGWDPEGFFRILTADAPVAAAAYPMKNSWQEWTANLATDNGELIGRARADKTGHLIEAESIPMGFTKITRDALTVMREKRREHDWPNPLNPEKFFHNWFATPPSATEGIVGEDVWFSREWRRIGGKLWVDPDVTLDHVGQKAWTGNLHQFLMGQAPPDTNADGFGEEI